MKLYVLIIDGKYYDLKEAFTSKERAIRTMDAMNCFAGYEQYELKEFDLPFIGRSVCFVYGYYGFDYDLTNGKMYNIETRSEIFACNEHARQCSHWKDAIELSTVCKNEFIITDTKIASKDFDGSEFFYGDCMGDRFNVSIKRIRVNKKGWLQRSRESVCLHNIEGAKSSLFIFFLIYHDLLSIYYKSEQYNKLRIVEVV